MEWEFPGAHPVLASETVLLTKSSVATYAKQESPIGRKNIMYLKELETQGRLSLLSGQITLLESKVV